MQLNENRFNKGGDFGSSLLKRAIQELGFGRSVLADKNDVIIAGNDVFKIATQMGSKIRVVETSGDELIVVKRTDVSIQDKKGKELALTDNLTQQKNLNWDTDKILQVMNSVYDGFDPRKWHGDECLAKELDIRDLFKQSYVPVENKSQKKQKDLDVSSLQLQMSLFD